MRVCLLIVIPAFLFIGVESEVLQNYDFGECKQFFFEGSPPKGFYKDGPANLYVPICQKINNVPSYATYYDTGTKMPIFSAYKSESRDVEADAGPSPNDWFIEPGLCASQTTLRPSMQDEEGCGIPNSFADQKEAMNVDYRGNWCDNYAKGPLNPPSHQAQNESRLATFTLTNVAPMFDIFITGTWERVERSISLLIIKWCPYRPTQTCEAYHVTGTGFDGGPRQEFSSIRGFFNPPHFVWTAVCVRSKPIGRDVRFMRFGVIGWNSEEHGRDYLEVYPLEEFEIRLKLLLHSEDVEMFPANSQWKGCNLRDDSESIFQELERSRIAFDYTFLLRRRLAELLPQHRSDISTSAAQPGFSGGYVVDHPIIAGQFSVGPLTISAPSSSWATGVGRLLKQLKLTCDVRETGPGEMRSANQDTARTVCSGLTPRFGRRRAAGGDLCLYGTQCRKDSSDGIYKCFARTNGQALPCCAPDSPCGKGNAIDGYYDYYWCWTSDKHKGSEWAHCSPPYSSMTVAGKPCIDGHPCGLHEKSYHWCYTNWPKQEWDYCCSPWDPCNGASKRYVSSEAKCPDGWTMFCPDKTDLGRCSCAVYSGTDETRSWESARQACQAQGADLASVHSRQEAEFLDKLAGSSAKLPWIGLSRANRGSEFKWSDNSPVDFLFWVPAAGHKNAGGANNCAYMVTTAYMTAYVHGSSYPHTAKELRWSDQRCDGPREPYFCKKPATLEVF